MTKKPTGVLASILDSVDPETRDLIYGHVVGGTSTIWLAEVLNEAGFKISSTTLKEQRAKLTND